MTRRVGCRTLVAALGATIVIQFLLLQFELFFVLVDVAKDSPQGPQALVLSANLDSSLFIEASSFVHGEVPGAIRRVATHSSSEILTCSCVAKCDDTPLNRACHALWTGGSISTTNELNTITRVSLVISHCREDLSWVTEFGSKLSVEYDVFVLSKCKAPIRGAPRERTNVIHIENVGRCDHSYAIWLSRVFGETKTTGSPHHIVIFAKGHRSRVHQPGTLRSPEEMISIAATRGFACGLKLSDDPRRKNETYISTYHVSTVLSSFSKKGYAWATSKYREEELKSMNTFKSKHTNLRDWWASIGVPSDAMIPRQLTEVCYGGTFAVITSNIAKVPPGIWQNMEKSLKRGDNIEESHFCERSWAALLSPPVSQEQVDSLLRMSNGVTFRQGEIFGALQHDLTLSRQWNAT